MPKVSVLVPVYNVEKYLKQCLDSIIKQTLKDIEIICINDGSTDSSLSILEEFAKNDNRIKIINKENSGYGASMNMGLDLAIGEYIGIIESDDFTDEKMFEDLYDLAVKNNADIVKSDFYYHFSNENISRKAGKILSKNKAFSIKDDTSALKILPTIWSAVYKRSFLNENNIRFLETKGASYQDTSFAFKTLACAEKIYFTQNAYVYYRCDNDNSSVKSKEKVFYICDEFDEITRFLEDNHEIKNIANKEKLKLQFSRYKWNLLRIDEAFRGDFLDKFQKTFNAFYEKGEFNPNSEARLLLKDVGRFKKYIENLSRKQALKEKRQKMFSIRINPSRISIVLFGKHILEVG